MKALVKEIERFPEHDDHQKADQFAEQQAIEPPKIAGNNADSQIQPPSTHAAQVSAKWP